MSSCTIIVNSCDNYEDLWFPFFSLFKIQWPKCQYPILLNSESKRYAYEGLDIISATGIPSQGEMPWSMRLKKVLEEVKTEYVLLFLDDFFLEEPVNEGIITKCLNYMDENENIAVFYFTPPARGTFREDTKYYGFTAMEAKTPYRLNCQVGLWRKSYLVSYLREHEDPWHFETLGSIRSRRYRQEFYTISDGISLPFKYEYGKAVYRGKWNKEYSKKLLDSYDITIDYTRRGFYDATQALPKHKRRILRRVLDTIRSLV